MNKIKITQVENRELYIRTSVAFQFPSYFFITQRDDDIGLNVRFYY